MRNNTQLESVDLSNNELGPTAVKILADVVKTHPTLSTLNLSSALTTDEESALIISALKYNGSVKYLILHQCDLGDMSQVG